MAEPWKLLLETFVVRSSEKMFSLIEIKISLASMFLLYNTYPVQQKEFVGKQLYSAQKVSNMWQ